MTDSDEQLQAFGEFVRAQRRLAQVSQRNLARMSGVSDSYLSQIERGNYRPSPQVVKALATAFGLEPKQLYMMLGFMDGDESAGAPSVEQAVQLDPQLDAAQKEALAQDLPLVRGQELSVVNSSRSSCRTIRTVRGSASTEACAPSLRRAPRRGSTCFVRRSRATPSAPLVHYFDRSLSSADCEAMSDALAVGFQQRGIEVGDRVAVYLQNIPQVLIAVLAIWKCGAVVVPCNPMLRDRELGKILRSSGCLALICHEDLYADVGKAALPSTAVRHTITTSPLEFLDAEKPLPVMLAGVTRNRSPDTSDMLEIIARHKGERPRPVALTGDDVAFMVHTSGTTGDAKGAMNTHRNVVFATSVYEAWIGLDSRDVILGLAPLFHVTGLIGHVTLAMLTGSPLVLFYRFDVNEACRLAAAHRATFTVSAITAYIALLNSDALGKHDLKSLTKLYTGGAPTPASVLEDWHRRTGVRIQPMYGLTEATSPTHMTPHGAVPPIDPHTGAMSVGVPVCNTHVKVITDAGLRGGAARDRRVRDRGAADRARLLAEARGNGEGAVGAMA